MERLVDYHLEADKGKQITVANFEKLTFRALVFRRSKTLLKGIQKIYSRKLDCCICLLFDKQVNLP